MTKLTKNDLSKLDKQIDSFISAKKLLSVSRDLATIHLLRVYEDYNRLSQTKDKAFLKSGQDGLQFAMEWIYKYCPIDNQTKDYSTKESLYKMATELLHAGQEYSRIWDLMTMLYQEKFAAYIEKDGTIRMKCINIAAMDRDVADHFIGSPDDPVLSVKAFDKDLQKSLGESLNKIPVQILGKSKIKYFLSQNVFEEILNILVSFLSPLQELDRSWDLGGYTVSEFEKFWHTLNTLCTAHYLVCIWSGTEGGALESVARILTRERWGKEIAKYSSLNKVTITKIMDDLIYDPTLYVSGKNRPDVTYQPFFPLSNGLLSLSTRLVMISNFERNIWDLVSIKRESLHSILRNLKEKLWLDELKKRLNSYGYESYSSINFSHNGSQGELDLLIIDNKDIALCCEMKWLTAPDRINDVASAENEFRKGIRQAKLETSWAKANTVRLNKLTQKDLSKYQFLPLVLSKNTIGSGFVKDDEVPIINERLLDWILGEPHKKDLRTLWQVAEKERFMPKRGLHFKDGDIDAEFGGVKFYAEQAGVSYTDKIWSPEDINLNGL